MYLACGPLTRSVPTDPLFRNASAQSAEDYNLGNLPVSPEPFPVAAHAGTASPIVWRARPRRTSFSRAIFSETN